MDKWNFYAFYAFGKLHKLDNMPILEAWWLLCERMHIREKRNSCYSCYLNA